MKLSAVELANLTELISKAIHEENEKLEEPQKQEKVVKDMIAAEVRKILRESGAHGIEFGMTEMNPVDYFNITKALTEPAGQNAIAKRLQTYNDSFYIIANLAKYRGVPLRAMADYKYFEREWSELAKALNTADSGSGADWIPTGFSQEMIDMVELEAIVGQQFESFVMPTSPYTYPVKTSHATAYKGGEATTDSPAMYRTSTMGTSDLTFTAVKIIVNCPFSEEMEEDSIIAVIPEVKRDIAIAQARGFDNAIINGDTTTTHLDTGYTVSSDDVRRCWNGLRDQCLSTLKQDWSTWSTSAGLALFRAIIEDMEKYGISPADLRLLVNTNMYNKFRSLDQVSTNDKFGNAATIHNGELTAIDGVKIVKTDILEEQQNDSGVYDGTTTTDTQALVVNVRGFKTGIKRNFTLEMVRKPLQGNSYIVSTTRKHWRSKYDVTTEPIIGWGYNITK